MDNSPKTLADLRADLAKRFPQAVRSTAGVLATGIAAVEAQAQGLPRAAVTELVAAVPSAGSQLFLGQLLRLTRERGGRVALVDGADGFDPASWPEESLEHLVWVRCRATSDVMPVADLFARDANFELVVIDLRRAAKSELRRIPATSWYRLQRAVEQTDLALLVITPVAVVPSAQLRLGLGESHALTDQEKERREITVALPVVLQRQRLAVAAG